MATSREKFELVFEARENASKEVKKLRKELALLGGPELVKSRKEIKKLEKDIKSLGGVIQGASGKAKKGSIFFSRFTAGIAVGNIAANAFASAMGLAKDAIAAVGNAVMVAANVEELGAVLNFVGQRAGYATEELDDYTKQLRESGIAQKETNQSLLRAIQGNIKLTDAVKLGRIAQDAATIGQVNSSEAYQTLVDAIVKGRVVMLKSLGIQGTFQAEYKKLAKTLKKTQVDLTEAEKLQARLNLVMKGGEVIAGAYDTAMGFASKKLRSYDRVVQDLQVSIGQWLTPSFAVLVDELTSFTKELTEAFSGRDKDAVRVLANDIGIITAQLIVGSKVAFNFGQILFNAVEIALTPISLLGAAIGGLAAAMTDPFNPAAWSAAGDVIQESLEGISTDWTDIEGHIKDSEQALLNYAITAAAVATDTKGPEDVAPIVSPIVEIPKVIEDTEELVDDVVTVATRGMVEIGQEGAKSVNKTGEFMKSRLKSATNSMVDSLVTGRGNMGEIFKGIAQDFMSFFIKKALNMIITTFIPGLGSLLGGIFDTPVNDRMAADQGKDYMMWFTRGALAEAQGGSTMAVGITQASNRIIPVATGGGGVGGGSVMMNVTISGNVLSDSFIENNVAPKLQSLVNDGRSLINLQEEHTTGQRDVNIN